MLFVNKTCNVRNTTFIAGAQYCYPSGLGICSDHCATVQISVFAITISLTD